MSQLVIRNGVCANCQRKKIVVISSKYVDGLDVHTSGVCAECLKFLLEGP